MEHSGPKLMKSKRGRAPGASHSERPLSARPITQRPISDFFKLVGTGVAIVATVLAVAIWSAKYNISRSGSTRVMAALIWLSVGTYLLYSNRKYERYVNQLKDTPGTQKLKRQRKRLFILGLLCLLGAAWNFWRFALTK